MRHALLITLAFASAGFDSSTGRAIVVRRPLEALVSIPAGTFQMGADEAAQRGALQLCRQELGVACPEDTFKGEGPAKVVYLSAFQIDRVEVTVQAWRLCVQAGVCSPQPLLQADARFVAPDLPVTAVTWPEAVTYCGWRGARLPTEAEWERAARGRDGRTWPWGNVPRPNASNHGRIIVLGELSPTPFKVIEPDSSDGFAFLAPVGSFPAGASAEGVLDLAGNALEWTDDVYQEDPPQRLSTVNPHGPAAGGFRVARGGSWRQPRMFQRTTFRNGLTPDSRSPEIGFRCAR